MEQKAIQKPNVIYILADDMGYGDISAFNEACPFVTEHLDDMCGNGMRFCDAHATSAVCTPSRYGILTGRYNWRSRLKSYVLGGYSEALIEKGRKTIADLFRGQGYRTAAIGKWHLGMDFAKLEHFTEKADFEACEGIDYGGRIRNSPISYGFDYYYGISGSLDMPPYVYIENDYFTGIPDHETQGSGKGFWRKGPTAPGFVHEQVLDELTDKVLEKIEEYKDGPFFLYYPMPAPHTPILPAERFLGKSGTNEYGDFILHCDDAVGRIINKLKAEQLYENTILVFTSDNGCSPMANYEELRAAGHNPSYIFRGTKADIYEGGHRIPLIVQWPAAIPKNQRCDRLVCLSDFMATMADYFDIALPDSMGEDSVSNLPLWFDGAHPEVREDIVHQSIDGSLSIRRGHYKLELCPGSGGWSDPASGKEDASMPRFQFYDLSRDIGENSNLIGQYKEEALELKQQLIQYIRDGRSTPGGKQENNGAAVWDTISWIRDEKEDEL